MQRQKTEKKFDNSKKKQIHKMRVKIRKQQK